MSHPAPPSPVSTTTPALFWSPEQSLKTWPWATDDGKTVAINNPYHSSFEPTHGYGTQPGVGFGVPFHTVITSLSAGLVLNAFWGTDINPAYTYGGVILVRTYVAGRGQCALYYLHMDEIWVKKGDTVKVGQPLGLSGGQVSGGEHPATGFSTGPHIDVGFNNGNFSPDLGDNFDPTPWLNSLMKNGPGLASIAAGSSDPIVSGVGNTAVNAQVLSDTLATGTGPLADSFSAIFLAIDKAMALRPLKFKGNTVSNPVANVPILGGVVGIIETPVNAAGDAISFASGIVDWIGNNTLPVMLRIMVVFFGLILVLAAFSAIVSSAVVESPQGQAAIKTAGTLGKAGVAA